MTKVAIVTGTAHGIGGAIASALTEQGIVVHGIDKDVVDVDGLRGGQRVCG